MPPQQSYGQPAPHGSDPYEFIMSSGQKRSGPLLNASGGNRLLVALGGAVVLIILAWIILSLVTRSPKIDSVALTTIVQKQTELARISDESLDMANNQSTRNFAITTEMNLLTEQKQYLDYLSKRGVAVSTKLISAAQSDATDNQLKTAQTNGDFDQVYLEIAEAQLASYEHSLAQTYKVAQFNSEKQLLQRAYNESQLLDAFAKQ